MPKNGNAYILIAAILGIIKLTAEILGYSILTDEQINKFANYGSVIVAVLGIYLNNHRPPTTDEKKIDNVKY